jgi:hypothetical protein
MAAAEMATAEMATAEMATASSMRPSGMGKRGTLTLLGAAGVIGLASLALAFRDPSSFGAWGTAIAMACLALAQLIRLRDLNKRGD